MKFEVIYEQTIRQRARFVVEVEDEKELMKVLGKVEGGLRAIRSDSLDDVGFGFQERNVSVLESCNDWDWDGGVPEYYDHNEIQ